MAVMPAGSMRMAETRKTVFSGGEHARDILSQSKQTISQGIYLFSVKDLDTGEIRQGKLVVIDFFEYRGIW